jgi:uncharacterized protein (DUF433 family)
LVASAFSTKLYTAQAAAYVLGKRTGTVKRWAFGDKNRAGIDARLRGDDTMDFHDVIQLMAVAAIRHKHRISLDRIRELVEVARRDYNIEHPFAHRHKTRIIGRDLALDIDGKIIQMTGRYKHNHVFSELAEPYMDQIDFDPKTGLAERYVAMTDGEYRIEIDPRRYFGVPFVLPTIISVGAIIINVQAEGSAARAAQVLEIPLRAVQLAVKYNDDRMASIG